ncbi:LuxR family transcriptional regulator [Acinetobacter pittii]|uniref:LuxR family transcriptional regulator n=1 Tax=Acinetobacter pittii TaxID=48296 RepID=UPI002A75A79A|nr:LuxR C-terminal-related transcriptional regulator [Acinetobacter pittii]WPP87159.1 LuxR C-terminal-related transcriptional regulator [Acinetobacter pittii]
MNIHSLIKTMHNFFYFDAMQILWYCPANNKHYEIFNFGYNQECSDSLANEFTLLYPPGFTKLISSDSLPVSICETAELMNPPFKQTEIFIKNLYKSGFEDGLTLELNSSDDHVGIVHFSSKNKNIFNRNVRILINGFKDIFEAWVNSQVNSNKIGNGNLIFLKNSHFELIQGSYEIANNFISSNFDLITKQIDVQFLSIIFNNIYEVKTVTLPNQSKLIYILPFTNVFHLSRKELIVLSWMVVGLTDKEISEIMNISVRTVNTHVNNIFRKLNVKNRVEAAVFFALNCINVIDDNFLLFYKNKK